MSDVAAGLNAIALMLFFMLFKDFGGRFDSGWTGNDRDRLIRALEAIAKALTTRGEM